MTSASSFWRVLATWTWSGGARLLGETCAAETESGGGESEIGHRAEEENDAEESGGWETGAGERETCGVLLRILCGEEIFLWEEICPSCRRRDRL